MVDAITIKLYAPFSEIAGGQEIQLPSAQPLQVVDLLRLLGERHPALKPYVSTLEEGGRIEGAILVVNDRLGHPHDLVRPGDEVYLCPQIAGG